MHLADVEFSVDHPLIVLGATAWIPTTLAIYDNPAVGEDTHIVVRAHAGTDLIAVRLFDDTRPITPLTEVFAGETDLTDPRAELSTELGDCA
jgi:hypothetical protein